MSLVLGMSARPLLLAWWWEPGGEGAPLEIRDPLAARAILARALAVPGELGRLRGLLRSWQPAPAFALDDGQVLDQLAGCVAARRLRLWELPPATLTSWGEIEEEAPRPVFVEPAAPVIEAPLPEEEPTFPAGIDAEEIARILRQAAATGVPFCEECLKRKLAEEAAAPDTAAEDLDAVAAAAVLKEAAKTGVPFCEECMKKDRKDTGAAAGGRGAGLGAAS